LYSELERLTKLQRQIIRAASISTNAQLSSSNVPSLNSQYLQVAMSTLWKIIMIHVDRLICSNQNDLVENKKDIELKLKGEQKK
jgi:hypothetical protein